MRTQNILLWKSEHSILLVFREVHRVVCLNSWNCEYLAWKKPRTFVAMVFYALTSNERCWGNHSMNLFIEQKSKPLKKAHSLHPDLCLLNGLYIKCSTRIGFVPPMKNVMHRVIHVSHAVDWIHTNCQPNRIFEMRSVFVLIVWLCWYYAQTVQVFSSFRIHKQETRIERKRVQSFCDSTK